MANATIRQRWAEQVARMTPMVKYTAVLIMSGLLAACAIRSEPIRVEAPLNSELIEQKFGSYGVDVLSQGSDMRVTNLYSLVDGQPVTRTLAIVGYASDRPAMLNPVHSKIIDGGSIGQSFIDSGFEVVKETVILMKLPSNEGLTTLYDMMYLERRSPLAYHSYLLKVRKNGDWVTYARVTEVHSPEHLKIKELAKRVDEKDYFREKHPYTLKVLREFREFLERYVAPARMRAAN